MPCWNCSNKQKKCHAWVSETSELGIFEFYLLIRRPLIRSLKTAQGWHYRFCHAWSTSGQARNPKPYIKSHSRAIHWVYDPRIYSESNLLGSSGYANASPRMTVGGQTLGWIFPAKLGPFRLVSLELRLVPCSRQLSTPSPRVTVSVLSYLMLERL